MIFGGSALETFATQILNAAGAIVYSIDPTLLAGIGHRLSKGHQRCRRRLDRPDAVGRFGQSGGYVC